MAVQVDEYRTAHSLNVEVALPSGKPTNYLLSYDDNENKSSTPTSMLQLNEKRDYGSNGIIAIVDDRILPSECLKRNLKTSFGMSVDIFRNLSCVKSKHGMGGDVKLLMLSIDNIKRSSIQRTVNTAADVAPGASIVVMSYRREYSIVREVMDCGVKAFIPMTTTGVDIAVEVVRFVLAGGTYVPAEILQGREPRPPLGLKPSSLTAITDRQLAVIRAIQQGKANKTIAYELNVCESTIKVHVRNIMKKLRARNRTEIAIKARELLA